MTKTGLALWVAAQSLSVVLRAAAQEIVTPVAHADTAAQATSSAPAPPTSRGDKTVPATLSKREAKASQLELPESVSTSDREPAPQLSPDLQSSVVEEKTRR